MDAAVRGPSSHPISHKQMQRRDPGGLSPVQAKGELSGEVPLPASLAALPSVAPHGCRAGAGALSGRRNGPSATHHTLQFSPCSPHGRPYSAALAGLTRLSPPLVPGRWHQSSLHSLATEGLPQASEGQPKQEQAKEPREDSAGSPVLHGSLQR